MVKQHDFDKAYLKTLFKNAKVQTSVLDAIRTPAERKKKWFEYRPIFLTNARIQGGIEYWQEHREILQEVEQQLRCTGGNYCRNNWRGNVLRTPDRKTPRV